MKLDRDAVAKIVMNTSMTMAEGYRASTTSFSTDAQKDKSQACAECLATRNASRPSGCAI